MAESPPRTWSSLRRSAIGEKRRASRRDEEDDFRPSRVRGSDWREHGKGRNWPLHYMTEAKFLAHVQDVAFKNGWLSSHAHLPFFDTAGIPDLTLVCERKGEERALFVELKIRYKDGTWHPPKGAQARWLAAMAKARLDVRVWLWPDDDDAIFEELGQNRR